jgi:hypothetical protein
MGESRVIYIFPFLTEQPILLSIKFLPLPDQQEQARLAVDDSDGMPFVCAG